MAERPRAGLRAVIVDCHTHIGAAEHYSAQFATDLSRCWPEVQMTENADPGRHWQAMQQVDRAIVLAFDAPAAGIMVPNEYVADYVRRYPSKLIGFASVDPARPDAADRLSDAVSRLGLRGLKLGPVYQHFDPTSAAGLAVFTQALGIPVLCHQATTFVRDAPLRWARPFLLDEVATACPELVLCAAHLGHPWCEELMAVIRKHPNLYADVSALHGRPMQLYLALSAAVEYRVADRLLLGSDFPFATTQQTIDALRRVNDLVRGTGFPPVPGEVIEAIIHRDAVAELGIPSGNEQ
jgi:predicted TIM-barrel fold metal-dependent hydrolase